MAAQGSQQEGLEPWRVAAEPKAADPMPRSASSAVLWGQAGKWHSVQPHTLGLGLAGLHLGALPLSADCGQ